MSGRDELAAVVYKARWVDGIKDVNLMTDSALADAILAAGYRKPRTITTAEELDALDNGALIRTRVGQCWEAAKLAGGENLWRTLGPAKVLSSEVLGRWNLPATVLHDGGAS